MFNLFLPPNSIHIVVNECSTSSILTRDHADIEKISFNSLFISLAIFYVSHHTVCH